PAEGRLDRRDLRRGRLGWSGFRLHGLGRGGLRRRRRSGRRRSAFHGSAAKRAIDGVVVEHRLFTCWTGGEIHVADRPENSDVTNLEDTPRAKSPPARMLHTRGGALRST